MNKRKRKKLAKKIWRNTPILITLKNVETITIPKELGFKKLIHSSQFGSVHAP